MADKSTRRERRAKAEAEYKELTSELIGLSRNEDMRRIQTLIRNHVDRTSELYPIVKKKLAQTSKDSKHLRELTALALDASKRIEATARPFDMKSIVMNLMREFTHETETHISAEMKTKAFTKYIADNYFKSCFRRAPTFEFFYGALRSEGLVVKERRKRVKIDMDDINKKATTAKEKNLEVDTEQDSTPREVEQINQRIRRIAKTQPEGIPYFKFLVDKESFTRTVENIFHTSFLVKEGKVGIKKGDSKEPILTYISSSQEQGQPDEDNQSVLSFSMADYKRWIAN